MALYIGNLYLQNFQEFSRIDANIMRVSLILCFFAATKAKPRSCLEVVRCVEFTSSGFFFFFFLQCFFFRHSFSLTHDSSFIERTSNLDLLSLQFGSCAWQKSLDMAIKSRHGEKVWPWLKSLATAEFFFVGWVSLLSTRLF